MTSFRNFEINPDRLAPACDKRRMQKAWTGSAALQNPVGATKLFC
jgi:hypothetical protein